MLFSDKKKHEIYVPSKDLDGKHSNIKYLVNYLSENLMKDSRKELFVLDDSVYRYPKPIDGYRFNVAIVALEFWFL